MTSWFVPPIVVPIFLGILAIAYWLYRTQA